MTLAVYNALLFANVSDSAILMPLLSASSLSKFYGDDEIFSALNLSIAAGARIALVGPNGAGKTTLLQILAGLELPTAGQLQRARGTRFAYLPQRPELAGTHSLWAEQLRAFADLQAMETKLARLEEAMAQPDQYDDALAEYGPLQAEFERRGGYVYEVRIKQVLSGLGFRPDEYAMPLSPLSGGQKARALLCRLLLEAPDLLLLDEPTNHLDIDAVEWLENFLKSFPGTVLAVSHDRYFIDRVVSTVWELEFRRLQVYRGNYTQYLRQRAASRERLQKAFDAQQAFIAKEEDYIRRHMGSRWTAQAKGRRKKLQTLQKRGKILPSAPQQRLKMKLDMATDLRSGDRVVVSEGLSIGYAADKPLLEMPDVLVLRGETVAVIGPNGVGKSTLLKTLIGELAALAGEARLGANVRLGYFAQAHETLNSDKTIIDEIRATKAMPISAARNFLGRFMFRGEEVFRPIATLSGGERGRVALAKLALLGANLLLLDEPTNHLDIDSQEILQAVLEEFGGTILLVSHDRYLIDALATQIWEMKPGKLTVFAGSYQEYLSARSRPPPAKAAPPADKAAKPTRQHAKKHGLNPFEVERRMAQLEAKISQLEAQLTALEGQLNTASARGDAAQVRELGAGYAQTQTELESTMQEWGRFVDD